MAAPVRFDSGLRSIRLREAMVELGRCARRSVSDAVAALPGPDAALAGAVIGYLREAKVAWRGVEAGYETLLRAPLTETAARRAVLELAAGLELTSLAFHGGTIARACLHGMADPSWVRLPWIDVRRLAALSLALVDQALDAFATWNPDEAARTCDLAGHIDALYAQTFGVLPGRRLADPGMTGAYFPLTRIVHELERVDDRAACIAELVIDDSART